MSKKLLYLVLFLWLLYCIPATIFLNQSYITDEINTWEDGELHYRSAFSFFPAFVILFGFEMRHQDRNVQWVANIDRIATLINPFALFNQEFKVYFVKGWGVDYKFQMRQRKPTPEQAALRPGFPGLGEKPKRNLQSEGKPLKITIGGVQLSHLRDIWFEEYRFKGTSHVSGKFHIRPHEEVSVGPAYLDIVSGNISRGETFVSKISDSGFRVQLTPFHPDQYDGEKLSFVNVEGQLELEKIQLDVMNVYLQKAPWLQVLNGLGKLHCDLELREGAFQEKTNLRAEADETEVRVFEQKLKGRTVFEWKIIPEGKDKTLVSKFGVALNDFELKGEKGKEFAKGESLRASIQSDDSTLMNFLEVVAARLEVAALRVLDLSFVSDYFPPYSELKVTKGKAQVDGYLNIGANGSGDSGDLKINLEDSGIQYKDLLFNLQARANVRLPKGHVKKRQFEAKGTNVSITSQFQDKAWAATAQIESGEMTLAKPFQFNGLVKVQMTDLAPFLAIYAEGKPVPGVLETMLSVKEVKVSSRVETNQRETRFDALELTSDKLNLSARLKYSKDDSQTIALAQFGPFAVGIEKTPHSNRVILNDAINWFRGPKKNP